MGEKMIISEAIKKIMKDQKITQLTMAESIGKKRGNDVSARLRGRNMTFDRVIEMLTVLGYEVTIQPRRAGARPDGQYVIMSSEVADRLANEVFSRFYEKKISCADAVEKLGLDSESVFYSRYNKWLRKQEESGLLKMGGKTDEAE